MMRIGMVVILLALFLPKLKAQRALDIYIDSALENNIVLQQKAIALQQAEYALKVAKGMFYPSVDFEAQYLSATGGRNIEFPVGDMLNGVYKTLNQLTQSQTFPQLENQSIDFLPGNFYDAKLHTTIPIINRELTYNKRIRAQQVELSREESDIYKRELVEKVKTAYYGYLQALDAIEIYESAGKLAKEGKRVNEKLLQNGRGLPAYILRAKSEIEKIKAKWIQAERQADNAKRYFNFLLNRAQGKEIDTLGVSRWRINEIMRSLNERIDFSDREELQALKKAIDLQKNNIKLSKAAYYPTLNGFLDVGSQAENWKFDGQSRYFMAGLQLDIPLFSGNRNRYQVKQSELAMKNAELDLSHLFQQLKMSSRVAKNKLRSAYHSFLSAQKQLEAARAYQRLIQRGYREGTNTYIETVDARNQLTEAQVSLSIDRYKMRAALAGLERETASFDLK